MTDNRPLIERQAEAWMNRAYTVAREAERVAFSEPCFLCGQARGCKHRSKP